MSRTTLDLWVGVFVALGIGALIFLAVKVGSFSDVSSRGSTYVLEATFEDVGGLKVRAPVKSAGVLVGRVGSIQLDPKIFRAVVRLNINKEFTFPTDTSASILTSGVLGEQYVGLGAGYKTEVLKDGNVLESTQPAVVLEKLIGQFLTNKTEAPASAPAPVPAQ
ncbi:MAG: outer membrane lipid asymmetry maintenance protein MlaD [Azoarcus sp.]|jgi:phospholipid/cholesterol/gamma-HCH transport system substrate-binding protein|nr:outer membrane lipid asymmetry maintenance protein MlaD [Azoarcus sp.]